VAPLGSKTSGCNKLKPLPSTGVKWKNSKAFLWLNKPWNLEWLSTKVLASPCAIKGNVGCMTMSVNLYQSTETRTAKKSSPYWWGAVGWGPGHLLTMFPMEEGCDTSWKVESRDDF